MESNRICQSCSMPLSSAELSGTEKDGSMKKDYCKYCYENGQFTNPNLTLEEMETRVKSKMEEMKMDADTISMAVSSLPNLKRWRKVETA
ncbi:MAG TPA: zinc ribbon domain-containing protein [Hanamia sp.]|nr:zinc ribbon domain-containing protein [Hanamia sp.]